jgi:hypothetical protein
MVLEDKKQRFVTVINALVQSQDEVKKTAETLQAELGSKMDTLSETLSSREQQLLTQVENLLRDTPCCSLHVPFCP